MAPLSKEDQRDRKVRLLDLDAQADGQVVSALGHGEAWGQAEDLVVTDPMLSAVVGCWSSSVIHKIVLFPLRQLSMYPLPPCRLVQPICKPSGFILHRHSRHLL